MPDQDSIDTESTVVTTYVPAYQKAEWEDHAENLGMSQSEFVRSMVQAGRRVFGASVDDEQIIRDADGVHATEQQNPAKSGAGEGQFEGSNPRGKLSETVLQTLEENGPLSWEELVEEVVGDVEDRLDEAIYELQTENEITHSPRAGKYVVAGE